MVAGSVIGVMVVGILLDRVAGSTPAFTLVGLALGVVGGCVGFWLRVRAALRDPGSS
jgi:F0F1-type ATP synthase assembly protein I